VRGSPVDVCIACGEPGDVCDFCGGCEDCCDCYGNARFDRDELGVDPELDTED
jgi:hypothetical protein